MCGLGVLEVRLKTEQLHPNRSVLYSEDLCRERLVQTDLESLSPAFPHLSKPFRQSELAVALEQVSG